MSSQADDCLEQLEGKYNDILFDELRDIQSLNISSNSIPAKGPFDKGIIVGLGFLTYFPTHTKQRKNEYSNRVSL
jgi:hypothetical protein